MLRDSCGHAVYSSAVAVAHMVTVRLHSTWMCMCGPRDRDVHTISIVSVRSSHDDRLFRLACALDHWDGMTYRCWYGHCRGMATRGLRCAASAQCTDCCAICSVLTFCFRHLLCMTHGIAQACVLVFLLSSLSACVHSLHLQRWSIGTP